MKQIEILSASVKLSGQEYFKGDKVTLEDGLADVCVDRGWAKDIKTGKTNPRVPGSARVYPDKKIQPGRIR